MMKSISRAWTEDCSLVCSSLDDTLKTFIFLHFELTGTKALLLRSLCLSQRLFRIRNIKNNVMLTSIVCLSNDLSVTYSATCPHVADGQYCLTAGSDRTIRLWSPSRLDPAFPPTPLQLPKEDDGDGDDDQPVTRLPRALPIQVYANGIRHAPTALAVNAASTRLLTASDKTAVLIDSVTAQVLRQWHGHTSVINSVAMMQQPDADAVLATASYDATVCLWDGRSHSHRPIQVLNQAKDSVTAVYILDDQTVRTASVDGCVRTYDIRRGVVQCDDYGSPITSLAFPSNNRQDPHPHNCVAVSCLDGSIRVAVDDQDGSSPSSRAVARADGGTAEKRPVAGICRGAHTAGRFGLECGWSADASVLVSGSEDGRAVLYDCRRRSVQQERKRDVSPTAGAPCRVVAELVGHTAPTCSVAAHPRGNDVIITASYDGNAVVWASSRDYMRWEG